MQKTRKRLTILFKRFLNGLMRKLVINFLCLGVKEIDTGLSQPSLWDIPADKRRIQEDQTLQVARCTKIIEKSNGDRHYMINVKQIGKFVVGLGKKVSQDDISEGMRVG